jgi:hypothetical protein
MLDEESNERCLTMRKFLYLVLAAAILLVWGTTTFGSINQNNDIMVGNILHHANTLKIDRDDTDPLAHFNPGADFKEACLWVVGAATSFMLICPLSAWQMTIQPVNPKSTAQRAKRN